MGKVSDRRRDRVEDRMVDRADPAALCGMTGSELDALFARSPAGPVPHGRGDGTFILLPGTPASRPAARLVRTLAWKGKVFDADGRRLVNRVLPFGMRAVAAQVQTGPSWFDGRPCIILDYSRTSLIARQVRDEIREVAPGLYLGMVYWNRIRLGRFMLRF